MEMALHRIEGHFEAGSDGASSGEASPEADDS